MIARIAAHSVRASRSARFALALLTALAALVPAVPVRAATFAFSDPQTSSVFNQGIDYAIRLTASEAPSRVELHLLFPGSIGPLVVTLPNTPARGSSTLHYMLDTSADGHITPNTTVTSTWVAYPQDGSTPVSSAPSAYVYGDETQDWKVLKDGLIVVHWVTGPESFARQAAAWGNQALKDDGQVLGVDETRPVDFFAYPDEASFRAAIGGGARQNVGGSDYPEIRTFVSLLTPTLLSDPYAKINIVHELTHQVVYDATDNPYRSLPRWLNEGFAVYQSEGNTPAYRAQVQSAISSGDLLPLTALGWQFPTDPTMTLLGYAESVSAVDFIARKFGIDALVNLILAYRNGPTDDQALQAAIGMDMAAFEDAWLAEIGAAAPSQFGPQPAPSGPLPSDWTTAVASQAPATPGPSSTSSAASPAQPTAAAPAAPGGSGESSGGELPLVLAAVVILSGIVLAGIVLAGRRASTP